MQSLSTLTMTSSLTQLHCSTFSLTSRLTPTLSILPPYPPVVGLWTKPIEKLRLLAHIPRQVFTVQALTYDIWLGPEEEGSGVAVVEEEKTEVEKLKKALVDSFYGTDRGLTATSDTRAEIVELITLLEAFNPTPAPTDTLTLINGKWILGYSSFLGLFPLLSKAKGPLISVAEISHNIDSENFAVQKIVQFAGPWTTTTISINAKFEVRSPKRVQIKIEEGVIGTLQLTDSLVLPEEVEILGQKIDLTPFKGILTYVQDAASSVARIISSQPPLKIPICSSHADSWLLTTYLDEEIHISRGDGGTVFVLIKEGSSLLIS